MSSIKCPKCGFVTRAGATKCKRCGASIVSLHPSSSVEDRTVSTTDGLHSNRDVRRDGWKKIKTGAIVTALYTGVLIGAAIAGYKITFRPIAVVPGLLPVAWLLAGVLQIVTGVPFEDLSRRWDDLAGWQRGVIGISVFLAGLLLLAIVCVIILFVMDWMEGTSRPLF